MPGLGIKPRDKVLLKTIVHLHSLGPSLLEVLLRVLSFDELLLAFRFRVRHEVVPIVSFVAVPRVVDRVTCDDLGMRRFLVVVFRSAVVESFGSERRVLGAYVNGWPAYEYSS